MPNQIVDAERPERSDRRAAAQTERYDRGMAIASILQAIPWFIWAAPLILLFGFIIMALVQNRQGHALQDFTSGVLAWLARLLIALGIVLLIVGLWKCYKLFHVFMLDAQMRRTARANVQKTLAGARQTELKNEQLQARIDLEKQLPRIMLWAVENGYPVEYGKDGLKISQAPAVRVMEQGSTPGQLGPGGVAGLLGPGGQKKPEVEKPSVEYLVNLVEYNSYQLALGPNVETLAPIIVELPGNHIIVLGRSQMGKSSLVGGLLEQVRNTHDEHHLRFVILDLEDMTGRLFDDDPHILRGMVNGQVLTMHARNAVQVAEYLVYLYNFMEYRYRMMSKYGVEWVDEQPLVLVYFEEFLQWRKTVKQLISKDHYEKALAAILSLGTRGLKARIHLMVCAQVSYEDKELKEALAQLTGIRIALAVAPRAALAAGFVETALLNQVYREGVRGQFVIEKAGGGEIGMAANFDARALVKALPRKRFDGPATDETPEFDSDLVEDDGEEDRLVDESEVDAVAGEYEQERPAPVQPTPALAGDLRRVYEACVQLAQLNERVSSRAVERLTGIDKDRANGMMNDLEKMGYINRRRAV